MIKKLKLSDNLPEHIGIIMDGNGRWAQKRGLPRHLGHKEGIKAVDRTIDALIKFKIKYATFFAFSTENWKRPQTEIDGIFELVRDYLKDNRERLLLKNVRLQAIGDLSKFPKDLVRELEEIIMRTKDNDGLVVTLALNYGGRDDIVQAVNKLIASGKRKINENDLRQNLYTASIPDPDLVIRTSGENRVSNFMIYQMAYSELCFQKVLWPDYDEKYLYEALCDYSKRERKFGGIK